MMRIDSTSGTVTDVLMEQSTGSLILDHAALVAFKRWRFKPGTVSGVRTPVTFALLGVSPIDL
jgi:TonB family protein